MRATIGLLLISLLSSVSASDQVPAPPQTHPILLTNATIHPVSSDEIRRGAILFENGVITAVGRRITNLPDNTETIDLNGKHVYPGMIAAASIMGLTEIGAVAVTRDFSERGDVNPNVRAEVAYHPDSEIIPVTRSNGVVLAHSCPTGGLISGTSAVMMLDVGERNTESARRSPHQLAEHGCSSLPVLPHDGRRGGQAARRIAEKTGRSIRRSAPLSDGERSS